MVLQRRKNTSLLELLESYARGFTPKVAIQNGPPTPLPTHTSPLEQADKKRKRDKKGKEVSEEGEVVPSKELEPQRGVKLSKVCKGSPRLRVPLLRQYLSCVLGF